MTDSSKINIYLVVAEFNLNSGTRIGFMPSLQGLGESDSVENIRILLVNLARSDIIKGYSEEVWDVVEFWDADGQQLQTDFPLSRLQRPREVIAVYWTNGVAPKITAEQSQHLAHTVLDYARKNDPKHRTFDVPKEVPPEVQKQIRKPWWRFWQ